MYTLKALWIKSAGIHDPWSDVPPAIVFYMLRALMFVLSFVLEDWAIQELVTRPKERRIALLLVASSYVTWTWQCHTFSNAVETLVVLWGLVLVQRIAEDKVCIARIKEHRNLEDATDRLTGLCRNIPGSWLLLSSDSSLFWELSTGSHFLRFF